MRQAQRQLLLLLLLPVLAACGGPDAQTRQVLDEVALIKAEIRRVEVEIGQARTRSEQLDDKLRGTTDRLSEKLRRRIRGTDQLYMELDVDQVGELIRAFLEGLSGSGEQGGVPYGFRIHGVRPRPHKDRVFVSASASISYGESGCESSTSGYLIHLDRELLKLRDLRLSCTTPHGNIDLGVGDELDPVPLPLAIQRKVDLHAAKGSSLPITGLEIITPIHATISPDRLVLRASTISLRGLKP